MRIVLESKLLRSYCPYLAMWLTVVSQDDGCFVSPDASTWCHMSLCHLQSGNLHLCVKTLEMDWFLSPPQGCLIIGTLPLAYAHKLHSWMYMWRQFPSRETQVKKNFFLNLIPKCMKNIFSLAAIQCPRNNWRLLGHSYPSGGKMNPVKSTKCHGIGKPPEDSLTVCKIESAPFFFLMARIIPSLFKPVCLLSHFYLCIKCI